jgi:hypothetical protein
MRSNRGPSHALAAPSSAQIEDAGQQEFLNWVCLAGAMTALGRNAEIIDYIESYLFNSNKCFALFRA